MDSHRVMVSNTYHLVVLERVVKATLPRCTLTSLLTFLWLGNEVKASYNAHLTLCDSHQGLRTG
ncbi:hypothetical protein D3C86_1699840 [compost metagenome]